jgi:branched-chain amino acid transport system substrate-binding protein
LSGIGNSVAGTLKPAGFEASKDIVTDFFLKDPTDPQWKDDAGYLWWLAFMNKWYPSGDKNDQLNAFGPSQAALTVHVLKACGDELTRENVMRQAANMDKLSLPMLLPGVTVNTSPADFAPIKEVQMARFDGERWRLFGPLIKGAVS